MEDRPMRRIAVLLSSLCFAVVLFVAPAARACDCPGHAGAQSSDPNAGECPHMKDGKGKCTEDAKDCQCAKDAKDCKCGGDCKCGKDAKKADAAKPDAAKKTDTKKADAKPDAAKK
jgi:hypothetical protein